jgi:hypothetical protein
MIFKGSQAYKSKWLCWITNLEVNIVHSLGSGGPRRPSPSTKKITLIASLI